MDPPYFRIFARMNDLAYNFFRATVALMVSDTIEIERRIEIYNFLLLLFLFLTI